MKYFAVIFLMCGIINNIGLGIINNIGLGTTARIARHPAAEAYLRAQEVADIA